MNDIDNARIDRAGSMPNRGLIAYFAANSVAANLLMVFLIVVGAIAGTRLAVLNFPEYESRQIVITVPSPGSTTLEVYEDINRKAEEALIGTTGISRVESSAKKNVGKLVIETESSSDINEVFDDVKSIIDAIENFPPVNAEEPEIEIFNPARQVLTIAVSSTTKSEHEMRLAAETLQDQFLALPGVTHVDLSGTRDREISIELSEEVLRRHALNITDISRIIRMTSLNLTFGELNTDAGNITLQVIAKRRTGDEFRSIPLITKLDGTIITLDHVANIKDSFVDEQVSAELDGVPTVFVQVSASPDQSQRQIRETVREFLEGYTAPQGINLSVWDDNIEVTVERLDIIMDNAVIGLILVFLCLVAVFDLRAAFWITLGIPISFIGSLVFFAPAGMTLNLATVFAFFLLIGIVVDDAVVVGENIIAQRKQGADGLTAAITGARSVFGPLLVGTITTLLALVPLLFIDAGSWQIIQVVPYVAAFVLAVSLIEAFLILPAHLANDKPLSAPPLSNWQETVNNALKSARDSIVASTVSWAISNTWLTLMFALLFVLVGILMLRFDVVPVVFSQGQEGVNDSIRVEIRMPVGTPFEATRHLAQRFQTAAVKINDEFEGQSIKSVSTITGSILSNRPRDNITGENVAMVRAKLTGQHQRMATPREIELAWRKLVGDTSHAERIEFISTLVRSRPNLAYSVQHDDTKVMHVAAEKLQTTMAGIPGVYEINDNLSPGTRQLEIELTAEGKAAGLTTASLGAQLRARLHGIEVQRIQRGREEIRVVVNYPPQRRQSLNELKQIRIDRPGGGQLPLSTVATVSEQQHPAELNRLDGKEAVLVNARTDRTIITPINARRQLESGIISELEESHPGISIKRDGSAREEAQTIRILVTLVPLSLLAMYIVMAGFLRSYWKPLIAASGIPAAFVGAVLIHWILGWDFTFMSIFGVVAVSGVVVNDGLVLLDRYAGIRREESSMPAIVAAAMATRQRFRAVFLTSLTTILGLSPLLYERNDVILFMIPYAASMLGGLIFAGIYVLFVMPAMIMIAEGRHE